MTEIKTFLSEKDRAGILKFYQTIPTDSEGNERHDYVYNSMEVRNDVIKLLVDTSSLITTIESQNRTIKTYVEVQQGWLDTHVQNFKQIESQKEEIAELEKACEEYEEKLTKRNDEICNLQDLLYQEGESENKRGLKDGIAVEMYLKYGGPLPKRERLQEGDK